MTAEAADWSEQDLDRRFALGKPHDELTQLATTLDGLLDRLAASLRHEQRFSAELSHELRTPLTRVSGPRPSSRCATRATSRDYSDALMAINEAADQMSRAVETLVAAARTEATACGARPTRASAADRAAVDLRAASERARRRAGPSRPRRPAVRAGLDGEVMERILSLIPSRTPAGTGTAASGVR